MNAPALLLRVETPVGVRCVHNHVADAPFPILDSRPIEAWELEQVQSLDALVAELTDKGIKPTHPKPGEEWLSVPWCQICDGDIDTDEDEQQYDLSWRPCGWICRDCWSHRPCSACSRDWTDEHDREFIVNDEPMTWCELRLEQWFDGEMQECVRVMRVGSIIGFPSPLGISEHIVKRVR